MGERERAAAERLIRLHDAMQTTTEQNPEPIEDDGDRIAAVMRRLAKSVNERSATTADRAGDDA